MACQSESCDGSQMLVLIFKTLCCILKYYCLVSEIFYVSDQKYFVFGIRNYVISDIKILVLFWNQKLFVFGVRQFQMCLIQQSQSR